MRNENDLSKPGEAQSSTSLQFQDSFTFRRLIEQGDLAFSLEDWVVAKKCYLAAHFLNAGRDRETSKKLEAVVQLIKTSDLIMLLKDKVQIDQMPPDEAKLILPELKEITSTLAKSQKKFGDSLRLEYLAEALKRMIEDVDA